MHALNHLLRPSPPTKYGRWTRVENLEVGQVQSTIFFFLCMAPSTLTQNGRIETLRFCRRWVLSVCSIF